MKSTLPLLFAFLLPLFSFSQNEPCPCCTENHDDFDFWIGEWEVFDTTGVLLGTNSVLSLEDQCIINENWVGAKGTTGKSYNYFSQADSTWNQLWIDNKGAQIILKGNAIKNGMEMKTEIQEAQNGAEYFSRIRWTLEEDGSVLQVWDFLRPDGTFIANAFTGIYRKKNEGDTED